MIVLDGGDQHHAEAQILLEASGEESLGASAITLAETLVSPARAGRLADAEAALQRLGVEELALGDRVSTRLAELKLKTAATHRTRASAKSRTTSSSST